jgi:antitoxin CptB
MAGTSPAMTKTVAFATDIKRITAYITVARPRPGFRRLEAAVTGTTRSSEGLDERRKRLLFRSWHRGTREMDLGELERLAEVPEPELYAWITGEQPVTPAHDTPLFRRLHDFARNTQK